MLDSLLKLQERTEWTGVRYRCLEYHLGL